MNSAFFWSYALLQVPAGWLVDRVGVKYPYAGGFVFWSIISAMTALTRTVSQLFFVRLLLGVGEAVIAPASLRWIRMNIDEKQRGLAMGIYMAGTKIGPAIGAPIAAFLIAAYGWRAMFLVTGLASVIWLIPWLTLVPRDETPQVARAGDAKADVPFLQVLPVARDLGHSRRDVLLQLYLYFCITWLPAYFKEQRKLPLRADGTVYDVQLRGDGCHDDPLGMGGGPADCARRRSRESAEGFHDRGASACRDRGVRRRRRRRRRLLCSFRSSRWPGSAIATANYWALTQTVVPGAAIGRIGGLQNMASNLAGVAAPILTGWLIQSTGSYEAPMQAIAVLLLIGAGSYALLVNECLSIWRRTSSFATIADCRRRPGSRRSRTRRSSRLA